MKIIKEIKENIYSNEYYKRVLESKSFNSSIRYLVKLSLVSALASAAIMVVVLRNLPSNIKQEISIGVAQFPGDLVVTVKNGEVSMNKKSPFAIPMPISWFDENERKHKTENLVTIDTEEQFSMEKFRSYKTFALLTKNELVVSNSTSGEVRILPVSSFGNHEITHDWLMEKEVWIYRMMPFIAVCAVVFMLIGYFIGGFLGTMFALLFYALFVWLTLKIKGIKTTYRKAYQVALHAITIVIVLHWIGIVIPIFDNILLSLIAILVVVWVNTTDKNKMKEAEVVDSK